LSRFLEPLARILGGCGDNGRLFDLFFSFFLGLFCSLCALFTTANRFEIRGGGGGGVDVIVVTTLLFNFLVIVWWRVLISKKK
jgi:hypothetical protein